MTSCFRLGVIAKDGFCRPFDHKASGYTRSEAVCVMYLQRKRNAKRIYANLVYSKANCDGFKIEGMAIDWFVHDISFKHD